MTPAADRGGLRLDRWLWRARLFKTRSQAAEAVRGGHIRVNGQRAKVARLLRPGDRLRVLRAHEELYLAVISLPQRRGPAAEAQACYAVEQAISRATGPAGGRAGQSSPGGRPSKRDRRALRSLKGRSPA